MDASAADADARKEVETGRETAEFEKKHPSALLLDIQNIGRPDTARNIERKMTGELAKLRNKINKLESQLENPRRGR